LGPALSALPAAAGTLHGTLLRQRQGSAENANAGANLRFSFLCAGHNGCLLHSVAATMAASDNALEIA